MLILAIMAAGALAGFFLFPDKRLKWSERIQLICTCLLIFSMGVILGGRENFMDELLSLGFRSLVFAIIPIAFSIAAVYFLTEKFLRGGDKRK